MTPDYNLLGIGEVGGLSPGYIVYGERGVGEGGKSVLLFGAAEEKQRKKEKGIGKKLVMRMESVSDNVLTNKSPLSKIHRYALPVSDRKN